MTARTLVLLFPLLVAWYTPTCVPRAVLPTVPPEEARIAELWEEPVDLAERDQWRDAFRAGGYDDAVAQQFIERLRAKIEQGTSIGGPEEGI
jgi:hypothetical protein